jgi:hypothetical protein
MGWAAPISCAITSDMRSSVSRSSPFTVLTIGASRGRCGRAAESIARRPCDGTAKITIDASRSASSSASHGRTRSGSAIPGR